jgi:L-seryl-tRNA(Ser) seleniumtransferase
MLKPEAAARRALPSVDRLLNSGALSALISRYGRPLVVETVRAVLDQQRSAGATEPSGGFDELSFAQSCSSRLDALMQPSLKAVYNLTGTVLHTNLGRAVMPRCAAEAVMEAMTRPVNLEYDLGGAARGERDAHVERWLTRLTGAEAALVVNNNAAAVYLALNTLAARKDVLVSRGELVEIGGAFRIPDIMSRSGCRLLEVGTTNRTHLKDYVDAMSPRVGAIMKVHASNYAIQGFTASVPEPDLAAAAREHGLPFIVDLGSGMLVDLENYGLPHEPTPREALAHGADIVTFSGDKLLGGPQAGLIVGRKDLIARIRRNPMKRALRVDKMVLAALEAVLRLYADPDRLRQELPTIRWLTRPVSDIDAQAQRILPGIAAAIGDNIPARVVTCSSQIGSGSLPVDLLPSAGVAIGGAATKDKGPGAEKIAAAFRALPRPVIGRINEGAFVMDLRCLEDEADFLAQLGQLRLGRAS